MTRGREPPSRIQGFVLDSRVGQGGQGQVWKAHVAGEPDELRALKLIDVAEASSDERGRLRKEAEAIHRLNNKSIVRCHGMVEDYDGGWLALILDWIDGEPLSQAQDREDMTAAQRRAIVRHLAHALAYLHGLGVLHRDIKASNVMLRPQFWEDARDPQNVVLVDFGIAVSWLDEDHERRLAIGTVSHMAPELLDPSLADGSAMSGPATDVFSFGVLAWRLFTREHPLGSDGSGAGTAKSYAEAYGLVARGVRAWPVAASPPPPALEEVFTRCLAVRPAERARSGGEVAQLIEGARAGAGGTPEPPRVQPRPPPREASARTSGSATGSTTTATVSTLQDGRAAGAHTRSPYPRARRAMAAALAVLSLSVAGVSFARHREGLEWRDWLFVDLERGDGWLARSDRYRQAGNPRAAAAAWRHAASAAGDPALVKRDQALRFARTLSPHTNEVVKLWQLPRAIDVVAAPGERDQGFASVEAASVAVIGVPSVTDRKEVWFLVLIPLVSSSGKRQSHWYATAAQLGVAPNAKELAERCHRQVSGGIVDDVEATCKRAVFTADPDILASVASDLAVAYASNRTEPAAIEWLLTSYDAKPAAETGTRMAELCARTRGPAGSDGRSYRAIGWRWLDRTYNLRGAPNAAAPVVGTVPRGTCVLAGERRDDYVAVELSQDQPGERSGWMHKTWLFPRFDLPSPAQGLPERHERLDGRDPLSRLLPRRDQRCSIDGRSRLGAIVEKRGVSIAVPAIPPTPWNTTARRPFPGRPRGVQRELFA